MKIFVASFSGNTGKTTLSKHLLVPQIPGAKRIQIEDINAGDGNPDADIKGKEFEALTESLRAMDDNEHVVIDVGASTSIHVMDSLAEMRRFRDQIDFWIIPAVPSVKQNADTIDIAEKMLVLGIKPSRIIVLLNNVTDLDGISNDFKQVLLLRSAGINVVDVPILNLPIFDQLKADDRTVFSIASETVDFDEMRKEARMHMRLTGDDSKLVEYAKKEALFDHSEAAVRNLKRVFAATPIPARLAEIEAEFAEFEKAMQARKSASEAVQ